MKIPDEIQGLCQAFLRGLNSALGEKLYGVYIYGAMAFPEGGSTGDIDFHVILKEMLSDREKSELNDLHATLARYFPPLGAAFMFIVGLDFQSDLEQRAPSPKLRQEFEKHKITLSANGSIVTKVKDGQWQIDDADNNSSYIVIKEGETPSIYGAALDGYYILLEEARQITPPRHQLLADVTDNSWALHREHIRAGRCIVLQGPDPRQVYPAASWPELASALQGELDYVENHLNDYPHYCVLNLCRLMYSYDTRDVVVSKRASAEWAQVAFPEWRPLIEAARKSYDRQATIQDKELLKSEVRGFFDFACERIRDSRRKTSAN